MSSINMQGVVLSLGLKSKIPVERRGPSTEVDGNWQRAEPPEIVSMRALIQPMPALELLRMPEGDRQRELYVCYTNVALKTADRLTMTPADVVLYDEKRFEVINEGDWYRQAKVYRAIIAKVEEG